MPASAFEYFVQRRNARVVRLLDQNPEISGALQALLEQLVDIAEEKGVPFSRIALEDAHISRDNYVVARIIAK